MPKPAPSVSPGVERTESESGALVGAAIELLGAWTLAILQPLLDLIGREAPFLLHHRPDGLDLAAAVAILALVPPTLLWLLELGIGRLFGSRARGRMHRIAVAGLLLLMLLGMFRRSGDPLPTWAILPIAGGLLWLLPATFRRWPSLLGLFRIASLGLPVVVALFWISPGARAARASSEERPGTVFSEDSVSAVPAEKDLAPVVWVVFDELPLLSLLDADLGIDQDLCPNLAALVENATWYRNATTSWSSTSESIVSMLTGRIGEVGAPPTRAAHPRNLLTWLAPTHEIRAFESVTSMAPVTTIELAPRPQRLTRLRELLFDSAIVTAHLVAPPSAANALPPIDNRWGGFRHTRVIRGRPGEATAPMAKTPWSFALADARARRFSTFLDTIDSGERPGLFYAHLMLPHMPFRYLPSGRVYGGRPVYRRPAIEWLENDWFALETYQRHLLQVGFVDRLVGELRSRLEDVGLWDRAVLVVTSDHGASHWPGLDRRLPLETDHPDDILRVPLFIKAPGQSEGAVDDRPARTMDVVPTVADLIGLRLDWATDGVSLSREGVATDRFVLRDPRGGEVTFDPDFSPDRRSLARKLELFDPDAGPWRWVGLGPYGRHVGRTAGGLRIVETSHTCEAVVDQLPVLATVDEASPFSPVLLTGEIRCAKSPGDAVHLAAAVNGSLAGTGRMTTRSPSGGLYSIMTAEVSLRRGANELDLYLVSGASQAPHLEPIRIAVTSDGVQ